MIDLILGDGSGLSKGIITNSIHRLQLLILKFINKGCGKDFRKTLKVIYLCGSLITATKTDKRSERKWSKE